MKEPGAGGHRKSGSTSLEAILAAFIPALISAVAFVGIFLAIRATYRNIYAPRTYLDVIPERDKTPASRRRGRHWFHDFRNIPDKFVLQHQSLDAFLYLRFFKFIITICFIGCCITWPVLFPVNATGGGTSSQLDRISFSNVAGTSRLWAHTAVAWVFFGTVMYLIGRERLWLIGARQAYLSSSHEASRLSSKIVLFLGVPKEATESSNLRETFGDKAQDIWVASDASGVEKLVAERSTRAMLLESAEVSMSMAANKKRLDQSDKSQSGETTNGDGVTKWVDRKSRPTHRLTPLVGTKVDTIEWTRKTLPDLASQIESQQKDKKEQQGHDGDAVFVLFETQAAAQRAFSDIVFHPRLPVSSRFIGVQPKEVLWPNITMSTVHRASRASLATALVILTVLFWSIPIGFVGAVSNVSNLADKVKFLGWINDLPDPILGVLTGLLPPTILSTFVSYVPKIFRYIAKLSGEPTTPQAELKTQAWYFIFQVVQVFLITTFSSGAAAVATKIAQDPSLAPSLLAQNLPKASNFYLTYFLLQGLSSAASNLLNSSDLMTFVFFYKFIDKTPREKYSRYTRMKSISWGSVFPKFSNMIVIAIVYSCIAPLVLGFATIGLYLYYLSYRYNLIYVIQPKIDSKGECYARALQHLTTGVYIAELCLIGLFGLRKAAGPSTAMIILLILTIISHVMFDRLLRPLELYPPIDETDETAPLLMTEEGSVNDGSDHPGQRLGISPLPRPVASPIALRFESRVATARDQIKSYLSDPSARAEEDPPNPPPTEEEVKKSYLNPALTSKTPKLWLVRDEMGISEHEIKENESIGVQSTDQGAWLDEKNRVEWEIEDFSQVPVFKAPVRY